MIFCAECGTELDSDDLCPECDYDSLDDDLADDEFLDSFDDEDDYEEVEREAIEDERL